MSQEFVSIPVPTDRVQEVYELLAGPKREAPAAAAESEQRDSREAAEQPDLVRRIYRESPDTMKTVFKVLAARRGQATPMEILAPQVGRTPRQMAGALGAFGRRFKHRYAKQASHWPFEAWWDADKGQAIYRMSPAVAEVIDSL